MTRAYVIYLLMFAIFGAGMWFILKVGKSARAPDDLSGRWTITWDGEPPTGAGDTMLIQESGRFWTVQLGQQSPMSMTLSRDWRGSRDGGAIDMNLTGATWKLHLSGDVAPERFEPDELRMELTGPSYHTAIARRPMERADAAENSASPRRASETANAR